MVKNAYLNIKDIKGIILHSDLGTQHTSLKFKDYLSSKGIVHSFSRRGNPYDNACIESFHFSVKKEEVNNHKCYDFNDTGRTAFEYIESWYNRRSIHSAINYKTNKRFLKLLF
ncbi:integrase core domain-containing protein [Thermoanaerobacterium thermosaccharolyticum]|uniref:transposase n=1 Tax=Thermoanaerobacterium thermosaccharolyticum TaxID=1517 RepID=UPI003DA8A3A1